MTKWGVLLEFRKHPSFEMIVNAKSKLEAEIFVERFAVQCGWSRAELRKVTTYPVFSERQYEIEETESGRSYTAECVANNWVEEDMG
jgi:hypothetical protein